MGKSAERDSPQPLDFAPRPQLLQTVESCFDKIDRVRGAVGLREHVTDAGRLAHRPDGRTGDDSGPGAGREKDDLRRATVPLDTMGDRTSLNRNLDQILHPILDRLLDRRRHLVGLGVAAANLPATVADNDEPGEAESSPTLDDSGTASNFDDFLRKFTTAFSPAMIAGVTSTALAAAGRHGLRCSG